MPLRPSWIFRLRKGRDRSPLDRSPPGRVPLLLQFFGLIQIAAFRG